MRQKIIPSRIASLPIETMTRKEIAASAHCGERSVIRFCSENSRKYLDERRVVWRNASDELICKLYKSGLPLSEIYKRTGVPKATVHRIVKDSGYPLRVMGRPGNICNPLDIVEAYKSGYSFHKIEEEFNISQDVVSRILRDNGIDPRSTVPPKLSTDDDLIISLFQSGMHVVNIAKKLKVGHTTISNRLEEHGINIGYTSGKDHPNWKGGITPELIAARNNSEYDAWRIAVFERDHYTCQDCGDNRGHNLNAHHKISFAKDKTLRYVVDNGITLCEICHRKLHHKK
jgi:transposase-like protein